MKVEVEKNYHVLINGKLIKVNTGLSQAMQIGHTALQKGECDSFSVVITVDKINVDKQNTID